MSKKYRPRKTKIRTPRTHAPTASSDKARAGWFQMRASWPAREAPVRPLETARRRATQLAVPSQPIVWEEAGPTNIGGRMTCATVHPQDPDVLWAGAAGGGVWKSTDAGHSWKPLWHRQASLNVGSLAVDPQNPDILYCGTGEGNLSADSYAGVGLYKSADGGDSWDLVAPAAADGLPRRIGTIAVDPFNSDHLRLGTVAFDPLDRLFQRTSDVGLGDRALGGMYVSNDAGQSWRREIFLSPGNHWCHSIVFDPRKQGTIYASFTERGARNGIWRSRDGGAHWRHLETGLPASDELGRISLALAPSDLLRVYALAEWPAWVVGFFVSYDGGDHWKDRSNEHFGNEGQMEYNNTLGVDPGDADRVVCGGVDLHLTEDAGLTWTQVTSYDADRGQPNYAHADHHALLWQAQARRIYDLNDGGMDVSEDGGRTWANRSDDLAVLMYYDVDVAQSDSRRFGGGTQDNGTLLTLDGKADRHFEVLGGDGGWMVFDPGNAEHFFASSQYMDISRFYGFRSDYLPPADEAERQQVWMAFIAMDHSDPRRIFVGSRRIWRSEDDGETWEAVSEELDGSAVTAIEVAQADPQRLYVGTENGGFFRSPDGGGSWSGPLQGADLPGRTLTRIRTHPQDAGKVYVSVANFGVRHVFSSPDGGTTWKDLDQGRLPDAPCNSLEVVAGPPDKVVVASDAGVFVSSDDGQTWIDLGRDLPHVDCTDLVYHVADRWLLVATYGRGLWRMRLPQVVTP